VSHVEQEIQHSRKTDVGSAAAVGQAVAGEVAVDTEVKELFEKHGLGAVCVDVCEELGVTSLEDLQIVTLQHVDDFTTLKPVHKEKLKSLIERQKRTAGEGTLAGPEAVAGHGDRPQDSPKVVFVNMLLFAINIRATIYCSSHRAC
jgi:hypothetical protein